MTSIIVLKADQSYIKKKIRVKENFAIIDKDNRPNFSYGQSVFRQRLRLRDRMKFWIRPESLILWPEGAKSCFNFTWDAEGKPELDYTVWMKNEAREYVKKQKAKAGIQGSMFTGWPFWIMFALLVVNTFILAFRLL
jgi:hypothetical protein